MPKSCVPVGCSNHNMMGKPGLSFHRFPNQVKNKEKWQKWVNASILTKWVNALKKLTKTEAHGCLKESMFSCVQSISSLVNTFYIFSVFTFVHSCSRFGSGRPVFTWFLEWTRSWPSSLEAHNRK